MPVARQDQVSRNPLNISGIRVLPVIAELIPDVNDDIQTAQRAGRQPEDVDEAKSPVPEQKPVSRLKIALKHEGIFIPPSKRMPLF
jgi:hypothetical protein